MKDIKNLIKESINGGTWEIIQDNIVNPDFITIEPNEQVIEFHNKKNIKGDYFGDATEEVLKLKPMTSFEDSEVIYVRIK